MTCIVALKTDTKIYIGGDSAAVNDALQISKRVDKKVFIKNDIIFGFAGSFRMGQLMQYAFKPPVHKKTKNDYEYMCTDFVKEMIKTFDKNGYDGQDKQNRKIVDGSIIIGYNGNIYEMDEDYQMGLNMDNFTSIGCGADIAKGSMFTSKDLLHDNPELRITMALEAASEYSAGVAPPYTILVI